MASINAGQADSTMSTTTSTKYAFKTCPRFDPNFYLVWANDVRLAFDERNWGDYLLPPDPTSDPESAFKPDSHTAIRAKAFLMEAIPYEHKVSMTGFESAAEIFKSLEQQYGAATREDQFRFEKQLMWMRKTPNHTVEEHIVRFKKLMAQAMAHQPPSHRYKMDQQNQIFLATLEYSDIADEKWENFIPFLGNTWKDMTPESLFATTRTYYMAHILPKKKKTSSSPDPDYVESRVQRTEANPRGQQTNYSNRGGKPQQRGRGGKPNYSNRSNNESDNNNQGKPRSNYDATKFCHFHNAPGHSTESCRAKLNDPVYVEFLNSQTSPQQKPSQQQQSNQQNSEPPDARAKQVQVLHTSSTTNHDIWQYDTCCSDDMTNDSSNFQTYEPFVEPIAVRGVTEHPLYAYGKGEVLLESTINHAKHLLTQV